MGRTIAYHTTALGQDNILSQTLTNLQANAEAAAQQQAISYANQFYEDYQTEIWLGGVLLTGWILWVSWAALTVTRQVKSPGG